MSKTIHECFDEFMYDCEFVRKLTPASLMGYRQMFATLAKIEPDISLDAISPALIIHFFKMLNTRRRIVGKGAVRIGIKKSTVGTYWSKLHNFFEWLELMGHIARNPLRDLKHPTVTYEDRKFLKREVIEKIVTAILMRNDDNPLLLKRNLVIFYIFLFCGLRKEELLLLQVRDVDMERKLLTVRAETCKSRQTRYIPLHSQVLLHLREYMAKRRSYTTPYLIVSSARDDGLTNEGLRHLVAKLRTTARVSFSVHQLRHTFAVNFLKANNNIAKLKQLLGHTDIRSTILYLRCLPPNELRGDIENMSIDSLV